VGLEGLLSALRRWPRRRRCRMHGLWPGDGPLAGPRMLREYDAQGGWQLHFLSDHAPVEPFPGQPLMGGLDPEGERRR
jgi:hypothetical protein